jgi:two-component system chemotaxis sensor kinase CheA
MANVRGQIVPYIRLRDWFGVSGEAPALEQIVISRADGRRVGFVVDAVVGQHQTVIKNLGKLYRDVEGISGATILGDGTVALIIDIFSIITQAERDKSEA